MKNILKISFVLLVLLFLSGCEKNQVKVEDLSDSSYQRVSPPQINIKNPQWARIDSLIIMKVKKDSLNYGYFNSRVFVNEKGGVDKIVIIDGIDPKINKLIVGMLENENVPPLLKKGKSVKFQYDFSMKLSPDFAFFSSGSNVEQAESPAIPNNQKYYIAVDNMPEPIGGITAIQKKVVYPEIAKRAGIEGRVYVLTFINEKGLVDGVKVIKGIGGGCDQAAMKAVEETRFTPGRQRGKPVKTQVTIPIFFTLK